jgi:hypothetical protein
MYEPIADCVGERGVGQVVVPIVRRKLAGDDRRARSVPIFEDLKQVASLTVSQRCDRKIIDD